MSKYRRWIPIALIFIIFALLGTSCTSDQADIAQNYQVEISGRVEVGGTPADFSAVARLVPVATNTPPIATSPPTTPPTQPPTDVVQPTVEPSPTAEATLLPTVPPTEPTCLLTGLLDSIRIRSGPGTNYGIVGAWYRGQQFEALEFRRYVDYLFARIRREGTTNTWAAVVYMPQNTSPTYWVDRTGSLPCDQVPGWPAELPDPLEVAALPAWAIHGVPGTNTEELRLAFRAATTAGIPVGSKPVNDPSLANMTCEEGGVLIVRSVHPSDCPDQLATDPRTAAIRWKQSITGHLQNMEVACKATYWEVTNECPYGFQTDWWEQFGIELGTLLYNDGIRMVYPSYAPGTFHEEDAVEMREYWQWAVEHEACIGLHAYSFTTGSLLSESDIFSGYRHRLTWWWLVQVDPAFGHIPFCITEAAAGAGNEVPNLEDLAKYYRNLSRDVGVKFIAFWTGGSPSVWPNANLNGRYMDFINWVISYAGK